MGIVSKADFASSFNEIKLLYETPNELMNGGGGAVRDSHNPPPTDRLDPLKVTRKLSLSGEVSGVGGGGEE